jgi:hypothetical protein
MEHDIKTKIDIEISLMNISGRDRAVVDAQVEYYRDHIKDIQSVYSGGGCWHLLLHLSNGHIINITDGSFESSYHTYDNIDEYCGGYDQGLGWEYTLPSYEDRCKYPMKLD